MTFDGVHEMQGVHAGQSVSAIHNGWVTVAQGKNGLRISIKSNIAVSVLMTPTAARRLASMLHRQATRWERAQAVKEGGG